MSNPLLSYDGLPPFSRIHAEHIEPAVDAVLTENRAVLAQMTGDTPANWDGLVEPLQSLDERLHRAWSPAAHLNAVRNGTVSPTASRTYSPAGTRRATPS